MKASHRGLVLSAIACLPLALGACGDAGDTATVAAPPATAAAPAPATTATTTPRSSPASSGAASDAGSAAEGSVRPSRAIPGSDGSMERIGRQVGPPLSTRLLAFARRYALATMTGDASAVCAGLASAARTGILQQMAPKTAKRRPSCVATIRSLHRGRPTTTPPRRLQPRFYAVRILRDRGFALFLQGESGGFLPLIREDGTWKAAALGLSTFPAPARPALISPKAD